MKYINYDKLNKIKLNKENFYVLIDFDRTITRGGSFSAWRVLYHSDLLGDNFKEEYDKIHEKHNDKNYESNEMKGKAFENRFKEYMKLLEDCNLNDDIIKRAIKETDLKLRDGAKNFFDKMYNMNIPVIIISCGLKNVIKEYLKFNNCYYDNIYIYSNFYDTERKAHIFNVVPYNKNQISFSDDLKNLIKTKKYTLLCRRYYR